MTVTLKTPFPTIQIALRRMSEDMPLAKTQVSVAVTVTNHDAVEKLITPDHP
jgi:hypothetical protein